MIHTSVRKLELMHNFTTEAVRLLKSEDELKTSSSAEADSSQQYLFRALEENHEELRRLLLKRLKPRPQRNSVVSAATAIGSPANIGKAMKSSPLLGPFCGSEFWRFSLLKI